MAPPKSRSTPSVGGPPKRTAAPKAASSVSKAPSKPAVNQQEIDNLTLEVLRL